MEIFWLGDEWVIPLWNLKGCVYRHGVIFPCNSTNQGTPIHGGPIYFPCFRDVSPPMMATLNILGFTMGLLVWFFSTPVVSTTPSSSQVRTLCQEHQIKVDPFFSTPSKYYPPRSSSSSVSATTNSQKYKIWREIIRRRS